MELLESDAIAGVTVDTSQSDKLLRVLDTVVIKLEGGTAADIAALDEPPAAAAADAPKVEDAAGNTMKTLQTQSKYHSHTKLLWFCLSSEIEK